MKDAAQLAAVVTLLSSLSLFALIRTAPHGWQDEDGFHEGDEHADPANWGER